MAVSAPIQGAALARGLRSDFRDTWKRRFQGLQREMGAVMEMGIPSTLFEELYGYNETAPYPRRRDWTDEAKVENFAARNFAVENVAWDSAVKWFKHQRLFDQLKDVERRARMAGSNFATLDERVFFQIVQGTVDDRLLATIPNAPDGVPIYNTLDGDGLARFGVTGGNIVSGGGVGTSAAIRSDLFATLTRIGTFQDTKGEPAIDADVIDMGVVIFFNILNSERFRDAFVQGRTVAAVQNVAGTENVGGVAVTNVILDSGMRVRLVPTSRITNDDWYVFLEGFDLKPVFSQEAQAIEEEVQVGNNSDEGRSKKVEGIFWEAIRGYGVNLPLGTVKVDN